MEEELWQKLLQQRLQAQQRGNSFDRSAIPSHITGKLNSNLFFISAEKPRATLQKSQAQNDVFTFEHKMQFKDFHPNLGPHKPKIKMSKKSLAQNISQINSCEEEDDSKGSEANFCNEINI